MNESHDPSHSRGHCHGHHHSHGRAALARVLLRVGFAALVVGLLLAYGMSFQVSEGFSSVVTRFGNPIREVEQAGLFWKWPWPVERSQPIDMRLRLFNTPKTETLTKDQTNVILLTYVVWRVDDPLLFFQALGTPKKAEEKLVSTVAAAKNEHIGNYPLSALVSKDPASIKTGQLEADILRHVREKAEDFGVAIEQVGIKRIAYPKQNMAAALDHMRAERKAKADSYRAQGKMEAQLIRNKALSESKEIVKQGVEEAGKIRGEAEEQAAKIIEEAQSLDPEFYRFWRSLLLIKKTLGEKATIILRNDRGPFDVIFQEPKLPAQPPAAASGPSGPSSDSPGTPSPSRTPPR